MSESVEVASAVAPAEPAAIMDTPVEEPAAPSTDTPNDAPAEPAASDAAPATAAVPVAAEPAEAPSVREAVERFFSDALSAEKESLVAWPEDAPATIVQRAAVNLATSAEGDVDLAHLVPADVQAAVCPQGVSTIAIIHALTASATLQKARLVCECDKLSEETPTPEHDKARKDFNLQLKKVEGLRKKRISAEKERRRKIEQIPVLERRLVECEERREEAEGRRPALQAALDEPMRELIDLVVSFRTENGLTIKSIPDPSDSKTALAFATKHKTEISQVTRKHSSRLRALERTLKTTQEAVENTQERLARQQRDLAEKEQEHAARKQAYNEAKSAYEQAQQALANAGFFKKHKLEAALQAAELDLRDAHRKRNFAKHELGIARSAVEGSLDALASDQEKLASTQEEIDTMLADAQVELYKAHLADFDPLYNRTKTASDKLRSCDNDVAKAEKSRTSPERSLSTNQSRINALEASARNDGSFFLVDDAMVDALLAGTTDLETLLGVSAAAGVAAYDREREELLRRAQRLVELS